MSTNQEMQEPLTEDQVKNQVAGKIEKLEEKAPPTLLENLEAQLERLQAKANLIKGAIALIKDEGPVIEEFQTIMLEAQKIRV